jgi:hypothetical protein
MHPGRRGTLTKSVLLLLLGQPAFIKRVSRFKAKFN